MLFFPSAGYQSDDLAMLIVALKDKELLATADTNPDIPPGQLAACKDFWTRQIADYSERGGFVL